MITRKYVVRIFLSDGQCVWGDNDLMATSRQEARNIAEGHFLTPLLESVILKSTTDETQRAAMREMEKRHAQTRRHYLNTRDVCRIVATPSRAKQSA